MASRVQRLSVTTSIFALSFTLLACSQNSEPVSTPVPDMAAGGRLVVQGQDDNIYVLEHGKQPLALTQDAHLIASPEAPTVRYSDPTWSSNGWLSYVRTTIDADGQQATTVFAQPPTKADPLTILSTNEDSYIYGFWSPSSCDSGPECAQLAYLINDNAGVALHLARVTTDAAEAADDIILGRSAPFFYSWSPDGQSMVWLLDQRVLVVYDVATNQATDLSDAPGVFEAPSWSPTDRRLLIAANDGLSSRELRASHVIIVDDNQRIDLSEISDTPFYFEWSPDGSRVAWASGGDPLDPVIISPADPTGQTVMTQVENVVAFFWSPDSTKLAVVALEPVGDDASDMSSPLSVIFTWWTVDAATGYASKLARFFPTAEQFDLFRNFDQYAQSHHVWSPDSRYIVYADLPERGNKALPGTIWLVDTDQLSSAPLALMQGRQAIFSFK
jgi:TolB protein